MRIFRMEKVQRDDFSSLLHASNKCTRHIFSSPGNDARDIALRQSSINPPSFFTRVREKPAIDPDHLFSEPASLIWPLGTGTDGTRLNGTETGK